MMMSIPSGDAIIVGRDLSRGFDESCEVVVVGSGSGGSVVATILAESGYDVFLLEEGPYFSPSEYARFVPTEGLRNLWREGGLLAAFGVGDTPVIALTQGRCVGGSSVITGGVCFRIPSPIHDRWARDLRLTSLGEASFESAYDDVETRLSVEEVPESLRSHSTRRLVGGAESLGIRMKSVRRNTSGCQGNGRCNTGCPAQAKRSVDVAYLPSAFRNGARLVSDALVEKVVLKGGCARGVEGRLMDRRTGKPRFPFRVRAKIVVLACGALHTPLLLNASGYRHDALGKHVTVHPAVRVCGQFDDPLDGHIGALQPVYSDDFSNDGLTIVGVHPPPSILAAALPGIGASHRARVRQIRGLSSIGGLAHDDGGGVIRPSLGREPVLWYRMSARDLAHIRHLITVLGQITFAAGAKVVYPPVFGVGELHSPKQLLHLEQEPMDARRIECMAFHPLGSVRMAADPQVGPVSPSGQVYGISGLYVADGSVLPTSIGVNSQIGVLSMATKIAWGLRDDRLLRKGGVGRSRVNDWIRSIPWRFRG